MNPAALNAAPNPVPTPVPIHDIVGPVWVFPWPVWMVVCVALGVLFLAAGVGWGLRSWLSRKKPPTAKERALAALDSLRNTVTGADPYAFGIAVSDAIRNYIHEQHGLHSTTQTSLEFLDGIRTNPVFTDNEKAEMIGLLEIAVRLVRAEVQKDMEEKP